MAFKKPNLFFFVALLLCLFSCNKDKSPYPYEFLENQVVNLVNMHRQSKGLSELTLHVSITEQARNHSKNMADQMVTFSHDGFNERIAIIRESISRINISGENISYGHDSAEAVVGAWLQSQGHKNNMEGDFTHTGVGIAADNEGKHYYTQIFIGIQE